MSSRAPHATSPFRWIARPARSRAPSSCMRSWAARASAGRSKERTSSAAVEAMARHRLCLASAVLLANAPSVSAAENGLRLDTTLRVMRSASPAVAPRPPASLRLKPSLSIIERAAGPRSVPSDAPRARVPPAPAPVTQPGTQALIVSVTVNEVPKGELYARLGAGGAVLLRREDLLPIAASAATLPAIAIDNEDYVDPRAVPGVQARFEEATLTLHLRFPPTALPRQLFDLTSQRPPAELDDAPTSVLFAYRAGYWGSDDDSDGTLSLSTESAFTWRRWLLRNRTYHARTDEGVRSARLETQLVRDDIADLRRLILGDFVTPGLPLG